MGKIQKPSLGTEEGQKFIRDANESLYEDILGNCIFCAKAIHKGECIVDGAGNTSVDYALQCIVYSCPGTDEKIVSPVKTFLYHVKCVHEEPFRAAFLKSVVQINQDFSRINDQYMEMMQRKQIKEKHAANLQKELEKIGEDPEVEKKATRKTKKSGGDA